MILLLSNNLSLVYTMYSLVNNMTVRINYCTNPGKCCFLKDRGDITLNKVGKARPGFPSGKICVTVSSGGRRGGLKTAISAGGAST